MRATGQLSHNDINDILDQVSHWFGNDNFVELDLVQKKREDGTYDISIQTAQLDNPLGNTENGSFLIPNSVAIRWPFPLGPDFETDVVRLPVLKSKRPEIIDEPCLDLDVELDTEDRVRPCSGGRMIYASGIGYGSIGVSLMYKGSYRLLSNNHVISNNGNLGEPIYQPAVDLPENELARVSGFVPVRYYDTAKQPNPDLNEMDLAWCDCDGRVSSQKVRDLIVPGQRRPALGEEVRVYGGRTGRWQVARIQSVTKRYRSKSMTEGYSWWKNGIVLDQKITQVGDSGSAYLATSDNMLLGLHRASGATSIGSPV